MHQVARYFIRKITLGDNSDIDSASAFRKIVGCSAQIRQAISIGKKVVSTDTVILVRGESGTGKEAFARAMHLEGTRRNGPFITVNCGAIHPNLLERELFGYAAGAFSGLKVKDKPGMITGRDDIIK